MGKLTLNDNFQKTLWLFNIAMEAMALIEIDGLPINSMVDLSMVMWVITRGYHLPYLKQSWELIHSHQDKKSRSAVVIDVPFYLRGW